MRGIEVTKFCAYSGIKPPPASSLLPGLERSSITVDFGAPRLGLQCCQEIPSILKAYPIIFGRVCVTRMDARRVSATNIKEH